MTPFFAPGLSLIAVWVALAASDHNHIVRTTAIGVVGLVFLVFGALGAAFRPSPSIFVPEAAPPSPEAEKAAEPPRRTWRYHHSKTPTKCGECGGDSVGGYWVPWWHDPVYGYHQSQEEQYCGRCAQFFQEAEGLGTEGVSELYSQGVLSEEQRDDMLDYLVNLEDEPQ